MTKYSQISDVQNRYLEGLKRCQTQGAVILIDGVERPEETWHQIFGVSEAHGNADSFYLADYKAVSPDGRIREIRLDKICIKDLL